MGCSGPPTGAPQDAGDAKIDAPRSDVGADATARDGLVDALATGDSILPDGPVIDATIVPSACGSPTVAPLFDPLPPSRAGVRSVVAAAGTSEAGHADAPGLAARFREPVGLAAGPDGILYVSECSNHTIRRVAPADWSVGTIAGTATQQGSADGVGAAARFNCSRDLVVVGDVVYLADTFNSTIRRITLQTAEVHTYAGSTGAAGWRDGSREQARFHLPAGLATDGQALYVSDLALHVIRRIDFATGHVATIAGGVGDAGFRDGSCDEARFAMPEGMATDGKVLYVADAANNALRQIDLKTGTVSTLAGTGAAGHRDGPSHEALFFFPSKLAFDGVNLFVAETNNKMIRHIDVLAATVSTVAGQERLAGGTDGAGLEASFRWPAGLALLDDGDLLVADMLEHRLRRLSPP